MPDMPIQTCPLCLQADELPSMVPIDIPHPMPGMPAHAILCRPCAFAIADSVEGLPRTPAPDAEQPVGQESES